MLKRDALPLPPATPFLGAGIYAIYYSGPFPLYQPIAARNANSRYEQPIYVGKAIPAGGRQGGFGAWGQPTAPLYRRLQHHAASIEQCVNLDIADFACRYLVVDDIWIPLGENMLIETFRPLWNVLVPGFGNNDPGAGRYNQRQSSWDVLHPGRAWAARLQPHGRSAEELFALVEDFWAGERVLEWATEEALSADDDGGVV
jgi:hypothetical protein